MQRCSEKHEEQHKPNLHKGVVVKTNANQRYATTATTTLILRECARVAGTNFIATAHPLHEIDC